jgi:small subunit ribosomal protein S16
MVKIRLARIGRHKRPFYRIVAADSCSPRNGKQIEILGTHDPLLKKTTLDKPMILKWLGEGAIATQTVKMLLKKIGLTEKEDAATVS